MSAESGGRRGGKTIVIGLLKRGGKVYAQILPDVSRKNLMQAIEGTVSKEVVMHVGGLTSYDGLGDWSYRHHYRLRHGESEFVDAGNPTNRIIEIESFWGYTKNRLVKFQGTQRKTFSTTSGNASFGLL